MDERWLPVVGFEGLYEVSDLGRVRSIDRTVFQNRENGLQPFRYRGMLLKPTNGSHGYPTIKMPDGMGHCIHTMVLKAFVGPCPDGMECLHEDDDRTNAKLTNLSWDTFLKNRQDASKRGRVQHGEKHYHARLTDEIVRMIRTSAMPTRELAERLGVACETVRRARVGISWRHVS
jgi:hypothetical protein